MPAALAKYCIYYFKGWPEIKAFVHLCIRACGAIFILIYPHHSTTVIGRLRLDSYAGEPAINFNTCSPHNTVSHHPASKVSGKHRNTFTRNQIKFLNCSINFIKRQNTFTPSKKNKKLRKSILEPRGFISLERMVECHAWIFATNIKDLIKHRYSSA